MPNVITHGLMANGVVQLLEKSDVSNSIENYPRLFFFGSNGPDFLFYYRYFSKDEDAVEIRSLGNLLHDEYINEFYTAAKNHLNTLEGEARTMALSYLSGHICHWALDSLAHPYIFHKTGLLENETRYDHFRMEAMIDTLMLKRVLKEPFRKTPSYHFVKLTPQERVVVAKLYQAVVFEVLGKRIKLSRFVSAAESTYKMNLLLFDKNGIRSKLVRPIEKYILKDEWIYTSHLVVPGVDLKHDLLNLRKEEWSHPSDPEVKFDTSFVDLFNQSMIRGQIALEALEKDLDEGSDALESFIDGRNYTTGLSTPDPMFNFDLIYKN